MGPWTTVGISAATGPDAGNVTDIIEGNFNVTVLKDRTTYRNMVLLGGQ